MPAASDTTESGLLNHIFRTNSFDKPLMIAVGLTTDIPTDSQDGSTINEIANAGAYARVEVGAPSDSTWDFVDQVNASGHVQNAAAVAFTQATTDWGYASGVVILNSGVYGTGRVLFHAALATPRDIKNNDTFQFSAGDLDVYLS